MISNVVIFLIIAVAVTSFMIFGEILQRVFSPPQKPPARLSHALDKLFFQGGIPKHSTRHIEYILLIHFLWVMLGGMILFCSDLVLKSCWSLFPLTGILSLLLGLWWAWRQGILK